MRSWSRDRPTSTSSCARTTSLRPARPCWAASSRSFRAAKARTRLSRAHAPAGSRRAWCWRSAQTRSRRHGEVLARCGSDAAHRARAGRERRRIDLSRGQRRECDHRRAGRERNVARSDLPALDGIGYLLLQLETPLETVSAFARTARDNGVKVLLNAAPACELPASLLASVDVLIVNEDELAKVAGRHGAVAEVLAAIDVPVRSRHSRRARLLRDRAWHVLFCSQPSRSSRWTRPRRDTFCGALQPLCAQVPPYRRHCVARAPPQLSRRRESARSRASQLCGRSGRVAAIPCRRPSRCGR